MSNLETIDNHGRLAFDLNQRNITVQEFIEEVGKDVNIDTDELEPNDQIVAALIGSVEVVHQAIDKETERLTAAMDEIEPLDDEDDLVKFSKRLKEIEGISVEHMELLIMQDNHNTRIGRYAKTVESLLGIDPIFDSE